MTRRESGIALVITLIALSILVVLLVGFVSSMSLERQAAHSFEETQRAKLIAQGAVSHAVDLLRTNIPDPALLSETTASAPGENWVINPGRLTVLKSNTAPKYIPLHTGEVTTPPAAGQPRDAESVDLNAPLPGDTVPAITGTAAGTGSARPPMRVKWVNLISDPTTPASATNRLVGRYAFWIDDECARVNFNTALGKPVPSSGTKFGDQLSGSSAYPPAVTPLFDRGDSSVVYDSSNVRSWSLGRPQSVNLDSFFDQPNQLLADKLLSYTFLHGFARYPQAILDFVNVPDPHAWLDQHRWDLTFYNRSPEFNTFGKSRYFTTFVPLSLEGGPNYQLPFIYDPSGTFSGQDNSPEILHLGALLGTFGAGANVVDDDATTTSGNNVMNQMQVDMILGYMRKTWPGYGNASFFTKYGEAECRQIALNILLMARMATTTIDTSSLTKFSNDWAMRSTSVDHIPDSDYMAGRTPERFYWRPIVNGSERLMLPQMPGPHITEVRLIARSVPVKTLPTAIPNDLSAPPQNDPTSLANFKNFVKPVYIQYYYEVEYYMEPGGPVLDLQQFPIRMDYLDLTASGPRPNGQTLSITQQFGPTDETDTRAAKNWNTAGNLALLATLPPPNTTLGPQGSAFDGAAVPNRRLIQSPVFTVGQKATAVPDIEGSDYSAWTPQPFDANKGSSVSLKIRFRPGMGILVPPATPGGTPGGIGRPRQMIPMGKTGDDTLQGQFTVDMLSATSKQIMSWQISDPRLSWDLKQWTAYVDGPGDPDKLGREIGTPGLENQTKDGVPIEPPENASQRSKFRYIQRAPAGATLNGYALDRGDEYQTAGRTASPGYWSMIHTGMQSGVPYRTLDLGPASAQNNPPDFLLLDLFGPTYPMVHDQWKIDSTLPDQFSTASYMNSTAGQVNLNSRIYPQNAFFSPPARTQPLTAVFKNLRSDSDVAALVDSIGTYQNDTTVFNYVGELANVPGYSGSGQTQWEKEALLRNMAGCLTTKSNTFGVWGVAQSVKKLAKNTTNDQFENGDVVVAEKRFYALVERYVWPGRDGVPGNAHLADSGTWDHLAQQRATISTTDGITDTLFQLPGSPPLFRNAGQTRLSLDVTGTYPIFDGPERVATNKYAAAALGTVAWSKSSLEDAYNPPQAAIKYRVVYFKYLDQ